MIDVRVGDKVYVYYKDDLGRRMGRVEGTVEFVSRVGADVMREDGYMAPKVPFNDIEKMFKCICSGQGGSVYIAECPIHDSSVNTLDTNWRNMYENHIKQQEEIKKKLGWT